MLKKITICLFILSLISVSILFSKQEKVTVIAKRASIYAEDNENSYEIDRAKMGDILILFEPWKGEKEWLYVIFRSDRWKGEVTGFIKSALVARGEIISRELIEKSAAEAKVKEIEEEGKEERREELPSLKDAFKPEAAEPKTEERAIEPEEMELEVEETTAEPKMPEAEDKIVQPEKEEKALEPEYVKPFTPEDISKPEKKEEPILPEVKEELKITKKPEPAVVKIEQFLGETDIPKSRPVMSSKVVERQSKLYDIEQALPPALKAEEAHTRIETEEEFKREEVLPPAIQEQTETKLEVELEPEAELIPVITEVKLAESELLPGRYVVTSETLRIDSRAFQIISVREESPALEMREEQVKSVVETEHPKVRIEPYEIKTEPPPLPPVPMETEKEKQIKAEEASPKETESEKLKDKKPEEAKPEMKEGKKTKEQEVLPAPQQKPPPELIKPELPAVQRIGPFLISFGFGPSYGGLGTALQLNTKSGFSIHAGVGYYPAKLHYSQFDWLDNQVLFSIGIKYYFFFLHEKLRPYLNLQYGGLTVEAVRVPTGIWYGEKTYENVQKNLYGPSLLVGVDWKLGRMGLNGAFGLSYNMTDWEYWERDLFLNGEFAISVYF